jgi:formylglycine-generating enzyme required for sulfatase activity
MVLIPAGEFIMGSDSKDTQGEALQYGFPTPWYEDERPARRLSLPKFYIDRREVTNREYKKFIDASGHRPPSRWTNRSYPANEESHPVAGVDWYDANDYCQWAKKRLPTEEEWEKAARGSDGRLYPWGNEFDPSKGNLSTDPAIFGRAAAVGQYPSGRSPYGVEDMIGNVWEWTDSWYLPYPGNEKFDPNYGMKARVVRGLSFNPLGHYPREAYPKILAVFARASARSFEAPTTVVEDLGFRCAKSD